MDVDAILKQTIYPKFAQRMERSIYLNFEQGGRPVKWKPSLRAKQTGRKTLLDKHILQNSIFAKATGTGIIIGTPVVYAAIHNFGGHIDKNVTVRKHTRRTKHGITTVKSHARKMNLEIAKREFFLIQNSDREYLNNLIFDLIINKIGK
jgi:phage gpG-like protein